MNPLSICICGGGSLGHVVAGYLAATHPQLSIRVLTSRPQLWDKQLQVHCPDGKVLVGSLALVSANPADVVADADVVILCLPGTAIREELLRIQPFVSSTTYVGAIFSSTGFFFEALAILGSQCKLWGFQRVPFIARTTQYGHAANLLGFKDAHKIAIENATLVEKEAFRQWVETAFGRPTTLLNNYYEASLTNSNPLLHTSRLYTMFHKWHEGISYPRNYAFYEEWTTEASDYYIHMDEELFSLLAVLPVSPNFLPTALDYYESTDSPSLTKKLSSIEGFKGIPSPMKEIALGEWIPDFASRYFTEDFGLSLKYIWQMLHEHHIPSPYIDKVYAWGVAMLHKSADDLKSNSAVTTAEFKSYRN